MRKVMAQIVALVGYCSTSWAQDFKIPKPQDAPQALPVIPPVSTMLPPSVSGPSTMVLIIGVAVAAVAAILFMFVKGGLFNHLIDKRVPPSSARSASWAFYTFLIATTWSAIAGFVVGLWSSIPFLAGGGAVSLTTLIFFLVSYSAALKRAK